MNRAELARHVLSEGLSGYRIVDIDDAAWLSQFPGGFAPMPQIEDESVLRINAATIAEVGGGLTDGQFDTFCKAICAWQRNTMMSYLMRLAPDLVVLKFVDDFPAEGTFLAVMANQSALPITEFLGANGRERYQP